jgi:hypothetical protein
MGGSSRRLFSGGWGLACVLLVARGALAFCRTTTCDPSGSTAPDACQYDDDGCATNGTPLAWPKACVAFSVNRLASPKLGIDLPTFDAVVSDSLFEWAHVDCGNGEPSIGLFDRSPVDCAQVQYNSSAPNANIWMFRDDHWPYSGRGTLALTTVTYSPTTGQIYDADVEINSAQNNVTVGDARIRLDLKSIVIHEAGHTLGLSHSPVTYSTMFQYYDPMDVSFRSLSSDDIAGICTVYPPGQDRGTCDATPINGMSTECAVPAKKGCALGAPIRPTLWSLGGVGLLAGLALVRARRRRRP